MRSIIVVILLAIFLEGLFCQKFHVVNLGGWLVVEEYIVDPGNDLKKHIESFVTERDFEFLSSQQINAVRIPVPWQISTNENPLRQKALANALVWGSNHNIKIIIDLHSAPGAQNKESHSGSVNGQCNWRKPENVQKTLTVIETLSQRYARHPAFLGMELLNEPSASCTDVKTLKNFYAKGYEIVRKYNPDAYLFFCQIIGLDTNRASELLSPGQTKVVLDIHYYNVFQGGCTQSKADDALQCIGNRKGTIDYLNTKALVMVGEWTNEWFVSDKSEQQYTALGCQQLKTYGEASFGWAYWTLKTTTDRYKRWSFMESLKNLPKNCWK